MRIAFYAPLKSPTHTIPSGDRRVGRLLMEDSAKWSFERGLDFDQRTGEAKYKATWTNRNDYVHSFYWTKSHTVAAYLSARRAIKNMVAQLRQQSKKLPWMRSGVAPVVESVPNK